MTIRSIQAVVTNAYGRPLLTIIGTEDHVIVTRAMDEIEHPLLPANWCVQVELIDDPEGWRHGSVEGVLVIYERTPRPGYVPMDKVFNRVLACAERLARDFAAIT